MNKSNQIQRSETMATNDATIVKIKHEILEEVAKLVFAGKIKKKNPIIMRTESPKNTVTKKRQIKKTN